MATPQTMLGSAHLVHYVGQYLILVKYCSTIATPLWWIISPPSENLIEGSHITMPPGIYHLEDVIILNVYFQIFY